MDHLRGHINTTKSFENFATVYQRNDPKLVAAAVATPSKYRFPELVGKAPAFHFRYGFKQSFLDVCNGVLRKNDWDNALTFGSVAHVEQLDDDHVLFYRRIMAVTSKEPSYERLIFNRQNRSIESASVCDNIDGSEFALETSVFHQDVGFKNASEGTTSMDTFALENAGENTVRVEIFKAHVSKVLQAMQFTKWDTEQAE